MQNRILIAPSLLAADFSDLRSEIYKIESAGADILHLDIMDGHFVPNLSFGPALVHSLRKLTKLFFDVHLMLSNPGDFIDSFARAGADGITIHLEAVPDPDTLLNYIGKLGLKRGLSINPDFPIEDLSGKVQNIDLLLLMSVFAGFGGQSFIPESLSRISDSRSLLSSLGRSEVEIEVDGGVNITNSSSIISSGADILVAGTAIFSSPDPSLVIQQLRG